MILCLDIRRAVEIVEADDRKKAADHTEDAKGKPLA